VVADVAPEAERELPRARVATAPIAAADVATAAAIRRSALGEAGDAADADTGWVAAADGAGAR
jgi:hypothetical protein